MEELDKQMDEIRAERDRLHEELEILNERRNELLAEQRAETVVAEMSEQDRTAVIKALGIGSGEKVNGS